MSGTETEAGPDSRGGGALRLLRHRRAFRALWSARAVSFLGDSLSQVALLLHVAHTTGQALAVSSLLLASDFAPSLLSPLTGTLSDRFDLKRVMVLCELIQGVLVLVLALVLPPLPVLLVWVAARALAGRVFHPASQSAVPALVEGRELEAANAALGFGTNGAEALGPLLAAAMLPFLGVRGVLLVDAASFFASAAVLASLPSLPPARVEERPPASFLHQARVGLGYIASAPVARVVVLGFFAIVAFNGVDDVALVMLAQHTFRAGDSAVGLLLGAVGTGLLCGYGLLARLGSRASMARLLVLGFAVSSLGNLLTGLAWALPAAVAMQAVRGMGIASMDVATHTLLQRRVPPEMLGRVLGNLHGAIGVAAALSYVGGGLLLDATSAPVTLVLVGAGGTVAALVTAWALPRAFRRASPRRRHSPDGRTESSD